MEKIIEKIPPIPILLVLSLLIIWPLFLPGYFSHHDDLQVMRIFEMRKCFDDLQIPCRWVPDMGYGNGFPLFNFYSPLPYYLGAIFSYLTGFVVAAKLLFLIPLVLAGVSMYLLVSQILDKNAGFVSGILYLFAPYRALDSYVRGDVAESFAISIIPLVFYFYFKLIQKKNISNLIWSSLSLAAFLLSHNIMILFFLPMLLLFIFYFLIKNKFKYWLQIIISLFLGFGLAAFFIIPAFSEKNLVSVDSLTRFDLDFRVHFVTFSQLFLKRDWGYGASIYGPNDTISFQVGWPHWWIIILTCLLYLIIVLRKKLSFFQKFNFSLPSENFKSENLKLFIMFFVIFIFSIFMTHNQSAFIWEKIGILRFVQFPWRFLSVSIFSASIIAGLGQSVLTKKMKFSFLILILLLTLLLNWSFFKPDKFYFSVNDQAKLSGQSFLEQQRAGILDYLPITALEPQELAPTSPFSLDNSKIDNFYNRSNNWSFNLSNVKPTTVDVPVFDFPNWQVSLNGKSIPHTISKVGRIELNINQPGNYLVEGKFENTRIRTISNLISLFSIIVLFSLLIYEKIIRKR